MNFYEWWGNFVSEHAEDIEAAADSDIAHDAWNAAVKECQKTLQALLTEAENDVEQYGGQGGEYWDGRHAATLECFNANVIRREKK